jgi:hypothetical protein
MGGCAALRYPDGRACAAESARETLPLSEWRVMISAAVARPRRRAQAGHVHATIALSRAHCSRRCHTTTKFSASGSAAGTALDIYRCYLSKQTIYDGNNHIDRSKHRRNKMAERAFPLVAAKLDNLLLLVVAPLF